MYERASDFIRGSGRLRSIMPGIRGKLSFSTGLFVALVLLAATFFNYVHEGKILSESFARETESSLRYINSAVTDMENSRSILLLIEDMKLRIAEKQRDLKKYQLVVYRKESSLANAFRGIGKAFGMRVQYSYRPVGIDTYYSIYLSDRDIQNLEKSLLSQLSQKNGQPVQMQEFKVLQARARYVAAVERNIENYQQLINERESQIALGSDKKNTPGITAAEINKLKNENRYYAALIKNETKRKQYFDQIFRYQLKSYYEGYLRRIEGIGLHRGTIRILTFDRGGNASYDTAQYIREGVMRFDKLLKNAQYIHDRDAFFKNAGGVVSSSDRAEFDYMIGQNSFHVEYLPVYRNPQTYERVNCIIREVEKNPARWKPYLKEDARIASLIFTVTEKMRTRLNELKEKKIAPATDRTFIILYADYQKLLAERMQIFEKRNPYKNETNDIIGYYAAQIASVQSEMAAAKRKLLALQNPPADNTKKPALPDKDEVERLTAVINDLASRIQSLELDRVKAQEDIGLSEKLTAIDAFRNIRDAALYDFAVLRQENDPFVFRDYLSTKKTRITENARWNMMRIWVMNGRSETELPVMVYGTSIKTIENGILSYSRSEVEEFMWKLDSTPLVSDIGFFTGIKLRSDGLMATLLENSVTGYNAVLVDKTDGLRMVNANRRTMLIVSGIIALCAVILTYFFAGFMVGRIRTISGQAKKVSEGELNIVFPEKGIDEIEEMSISLNTMMKGLREKEALKGEIAAAGEIQKQLLPEKIPATLDDHYTIASFYRSMQGVGGDYYDFIGLDEGRMFFCIADVSNHGVGPAIVMAMARAHLHAIINRGEHDLIKIMLELNQQIYLETPPNIFITFFAGIVNRANHEVHYCSAGHLKPIVYRHKTDTVEQLAAGGLPVGMDANDFFAQTITVQKTKLLAGDIFFQYTDGVSEAMNDKREQYGDEKLMSKIKISARKKTEVMIDEIAHSIERFTKKELFTSSGVTELNDDLAMIAFKRIK